MTRRLITVDSHTAGEPTRVVVQGGPQLGSGPLSQRVERFRAEFDHYRSAICTEPRGSDVVVGALLCSPHDETCATGVIFFNNVGYLGMCGHGMMGLIATLNHLGQISSGPQRIETPVGVVHTDLLDDGSVAVQNVASYREAEAVSVNVEGQGTLRGDVAWGGNWFFLAESPLDLNLANIQPLMELAGQTRQAVHARGYPQVDHVEFFRHAGATANSRNFVLCPGDQYDRSPCGTGTSAKLACLAADGELDEGEQWVQEGILGTSFCGTYRRLQDGKIEPTVRGKAYVTAESTLLLDEQDPFCWGIGGLPPESDEVR